MHLANSASWSANPPGVRFRVGPAGLPTPRFLVSLRSAEQGTTAKTLYHSLRPDSRLFSVVPSLTPFSFGPRFANAATPFAGRICHCIRAATVHFQIVEGAAAMAAGW